MTQWILPFALVFSGLLFGLIFERFIINKIKALAAKAHLPGNKILFESLRGVTFIWFVVAGSYIALISIPLEPEISDVLQKILTIFFLYSVTLFLARLIAAFVTLYTRKAKGALPSASLLSNLTRLVVFILGTLIVLQTLNISITPILTTLGIGGLAVALALQDTLSNLFSGVYLILSRQVRTGDYIKLDSDHEGYVTDITWRDTTIKELSNNVIIVPNSKLASAIFTNYHLPVKEITLTIPVGVSYDSDLEQVEKVTIEVAKEVMQELLDGSIKFEPFIRYHNFGDFSIDLTVFIRINEFFDQRLTKHEFIKRLHRRYQQEGIEIPFPIKTIYLKDSGNKL